MPDRRTFLRLCALAGFTPAMGESLWERADTGQREAFPGKGPTPAAVPVTIENVKGAEAIVGIPYTDAERELMLKALNLNLAYYEQLREIRLTQAHLPAVTFSPLLPGREPPKVDVAGRAPERPRPPVKRPATRGELAFLPVTDLAGLIRNGEVTATNLTKLYLDRLRRYGPDLNCLVTLTEERALRQAAEADRAISAGRYLGPLHGIPYGVKDLVSVTGYPTTWGAAMYRDRVLPETATVVERLDAAGAILIGKLSTG
jgi:hypothetical protein